MSRNQHQLCVSNLPAPSSLDSPSRVFSQRRAAVLICVMVLLLITGLIMHQTLQALLLVRRGDARHFELRQARELVELGKLVIARQPQPAEEEAEETAQPKLDGQTLPMQDPLIVSLETEPAGDTTVERLQGSLLIESLAPQGESTDSSPPTWKITVRYPLGNNNEFTVTEELAHASSP